MVYSNVEPIYFAAISFVPTGTEAAMIRTPSLETLGYSPLSLPGLIVASRLATFEGTHYIRSIDPIESSLRSLAPKQGLLVNWKRALAVKELLEWTVVQCCSVDLQTEEAALRFGATCCSVSVNLPLPEI